MARAIGVVAGGRCQFYVCCGHLSECAGVFRGASSRGYCKFALLAGVSRGSFFLCTYGNSLRGTVGDLAAGLRFFCAFCEALAFLWALRRRLYKAELWSGVSSRAFE